MALSEEAILRLTSVLGQSVANELNGLLSGSSGTFASMSCTGLFTESPADALTAVGTTQGTALALTKQINRITTSTATTSPFNGATLPASAAGLEIEVINSSANPVQVYGLGADTINGQANTVGVTQPANSVVEYSCTVAGSWFAEGIGIGFSASFPTDSFTDGITAFAGGGQGSATPLTSEINRLTVVANNGDSALLPASAGGMGIIVINHGAKSAQIYGTGSDTIDDVASGTGVAQMTGSVAFYFCPVAGKWYSNGIGTGYTGSLQTLSFADGLTAAGSSQATGLQLAASINRLTTVAAGTGANLPANAAGLEIMVINAGANSLTVYPFQGATDTINGNAATVGVQVIANAAVTFVSTVAGTWVAQNVGQGYSGTYATVGSQDNQTATGNNRATAFVITTALTRFSTVAASTGAVLPASAAGLSFTVVNAGANPLQVYAAGTDTINGTAGATGVALAAGKTASYYSASTGTWHSILSA